MFGAQGGNPPPWQLQGYNQQANQNGEPPAKKAKGNPVITKYPPPPNYRPPAQPPGPFQQQGWQQPTQTYNYGQQAYPGYSHQAYAQQQQHFQQPQHYAQNQWQGYGQQQYAGYPSGYHTLQHQAWTAPAAQQPRDWNVSASASSQDSLAPSGHPANWQIAPSADSKPAPLQSTPPTDFFRSSKRRNHSEVSMNASGPNAGFVVDGNGDPIPPPSPCPNASGDPEKDFDRECYFLRRPEDINPDLSIGELLWRPAAATTLALPATYKESQVEIIAPRRAPAQGETSVSEYFYREKRDEAMLSIRQLDEWWSIKDDPIFKEFAQNPKTLLPMSEMLEKYRDRPDPTWRQRSPSLTPVPECESSQSEGHSHAVGGAMDVDGSYTTHHGSASQIAGEEGDILGDLQQALRQNSMSRQGHSRANSTTSVTSNHGTKLKPLMPVRDRAQDDVLKSLGVTGSPKMVYETPGPAFGPPPAQREGSVSQNHSRQSSVVSNSGSARFPPPPPPGQPLEYARRPSNNNNDWQSRYYWNAPTGYGPNGYNGGSRRGSNVSRQASNASRPGSSGASRPGSSGSQHTTHGSDFGGVDEDRTPRPKYDRADNRKRGYEDYYNRGRDEDATPRQQRYKQPRVDDAYKRRW